MAVQWTYNQEQAITLDRGTLLVSAAAGSGKTAVLVERVIRHVTRRESPVDLDRLLVMTFSNAAAAQMREKIGAKLYSLLEEEPGNISLRRQQMLLPQAPIGTVHAFCLRLIREHFSSLGISHDFRVAQEGESQALLDDAVREVLEAYYRQGREDFLDLVELTCGFRDDKNLVKLLGELLDFIRSHPFPRRWLDQKLALYDPGVPLSQSLFGQIMLSHARETLAYALTMLERGIALAQGDPKMEKAYVPALVDDREQLGGMLENIESGNFDLAREAVSAYSPKKLGSLTKYENEALKTMVQGLRGEVKALVAQLQTKCFVSDSAQFAQDIDWLRPKIQALFDCVWDVEEDFGKRKREKGVVDFADIEHLALELLVRPKGERGYEKTPLAMELSQRYQEILVDEYQDTNQAQDMIFKALSRNEENLFMVGDVKQSIYRFRQASPELFLEKRAAFSPAGDGKFPAYVILEKNFRSCLGITEGVNFLFRQLMSRQTAQMDYTREEELDCGREYPESPLPAVGVRLLDPPQGTDAGEYEAACVAREIDRLVKEGLEIQGEEGSRPIRYGDFCILLRSVKEKAPVYEKALRDWGIPVRSGQEESFFQRPEIMTALSLFQVISNPLQDVPLTGVLTSPLFDFTLEELTQMRLEDPQQPLYLCLVRRADQGDRKCGDFLQLMSRLREHSAVMGVAPLIREAFALTRLPLCYQEGRANLYLLLSYGVHCEEAGYTGLTGFLRYLRRVKESGRDLPAADLASREDSVYLMSIHKSKGLEFPFCILADTAKQFNKTDLRRPYQLHPNLGFSTVVREKKTLRQYTTVAHEAVKLESERAMLAEEMRVLYVALTRSKEHLLLMVTAKNLGKKLADLSCEVPVQGVPLSPYGVQNGKSYGDWILMALLRHPDFQPVLQNYGIQLPPLPCEQPWDIQTVAGEQPLPQPLRQEEELPPPDPQLTTYFAGQLAWEYPHVLGIPAKLSVSQLSHEERYDFQQTPHFLAGKGLSPAQRGTALHKVMQFADYERARQDLEGEVERLRQARFLAAEEARSLDLPRLKRLFCGGLMARILSSTQILREVKFFYELPAQDYLGEGAKGGDPIILQGIADCVFLEGEEAVLVDYKTDRASPEELVSRYAKQLGLYHTALEKGLGRRIKETVLYSVHLGREIPFDFPSHTG